MKKIKFFAVALAALTMFSCSKENETANGGGTSIGDPTYATFTFKTGANATTKAGEGVDSDAGKGSEDSEKVIRTIRLLIFDAATGSLESNTKADVAGTVDNTKLTVVVKAGLKKMYIVANEGAAGKKVADALATIGTTSRLSDFYALKFDAGATNGDDFSLAELHTADTNPGSEMGFPMSSPEKDAYDFKKGISKEAAEQGNTDATNSFTVGLDFMLAKVAVAKSNTFKTPDDLKVESVHFAIRNIEKETYLTQHVENGVVKSCYYDWIPSNPTQPASWSTHYHQTPLPTIEAKAKTGAGTGDVATDQVFVYAAENTKSSLAGMEGGSTYAVIKCVVTPAKSYGGTDMMWSSTRGAVALGTPDNHPTGTTFIRTVVKIGTIPAETIFTNETAFKKALAIDEFKEGYTGQTDPTSMPDAKTYQTHTNGEAWYRIFISNTENGKPVYGVKRGVKYVATIDAIKRIGSATADLNPDAPLDQDTFISVTIKANGWSTAGSSVEL